MDGHHFDNLTRRLAVGSSRRGLLKTALAGLLGGVASGGAGQVAAAGQPNGAACTRATDCTSFHCVDGVCCDTSCTAQCESCASGICAPVSGTPVGARPACPGAGPCQATCDGVTRTSCAAWPGSETTCGASTCAGGWQTTYACGGNGTCTPTTTSCGLYVCDAAGIACLTTCASNADCIGEAFCSGGVCQGDKPLGEPCTGPDQCQHGHCVDGVCCLEMCADQCEACNVAGNEGFCTPTPGAACDDGDPCTVDDTCTATGNCKGVPKDCSTVADQCNDGVCRAADGVCIQQPKPNGTGCNDGNPCTENDACQNGACVGTPVVCDTSGVCQTAPGMCNPQDGTCSYPTAADNTSCGADQVCCAGTCCPSGQACIGGACQVAACLVLRQFCNPADNRCCQDEPTNCEENFCTGVPGATCCHLTGGTCTFDCECCGSDSCLEGRCCRITTDSCITDDQCCSGNCVDGTCQPATCLELQQPCATEGLCCQDEPTACQVVHPVCGGGVLPQCCRPIGGACTGSCDCCGTDSICFSGQCQPAGGGE